MFKNGISTGLMLWLFFLVAFVLLGYSIPLSIVIGAIGGLSSGAIVTGWNSKDRPPPQTSSEEEESSEDEATPVYKNHRMGIVEAQRHRKARESKALSSQVFAVLRRSLRRR